MNTLSLRDRYFRVRRARVSGGHGQWAIEIQTEHEEFDGERWEPCLYHQRLRLDAQDGKALPGTVVSWARAGEVESQHPERPTMYVFGHHDVRACTLVFGPLDSGRITLSWSGLADVFWDEHYRDNVPFKCECLAELAWITRPERT